MIAASAYLLIYVLIGALIVIGLIWAWEAVTKSQVPLIVKQVLAAIAGILILLRLLQIWGVA